MNPSSAPHAATPVDVAVPVTGSSAINPSGWSTRPPIKRRFEEALNYFYSFKKRPKRHGIHLLIFAQGRTGSTLLEHLLGSTGHFHQYGELFNRRFHRDQLWDPIRYVRGLGRRKAEQNLVIHVKVDQLTRVRERPIDPAQFLSELYNDGWSIIYLRRENKISQVLSSLIAIQRGNYHSYTDRDEDQSFRLLIDLDDFVSRVSRRFSYDEAERKALANIVYHEVIYEDDLEKSEVHQSTVDRILKSLSLEPRNASTRLSKVNTQSFSDLIINYDEFIARVKSQNWQDFLRPRMIRKSF